LGKLLAGNELGLLVNGDQLVVNCVLGCESAA
jgi:hypothetical protein